MSSKVEIANLALGHIGVSESIANIDTERGPAALQCKRFYNQDVDFVLRAFDWNFATGYQALGLVDDDVGDDWTYAYRYPSSALKVRRIVTSLGRRDPNPTPWVIGRDTQGQLIYTNQQDAIVEYTARVTDPSSFDPMFVEALSWKLAADIAPSLSRIKGMATTAYQMFVATLLMAETAAAGEQQDDVAPDSEFVRARA